MEQIILNILEALRRGETVDDKALVKLIHAEARREGADKRDLAKRCLLPFYQRVKRVSRFGGLRGMSIPIWSVNCCRSCV